MSVIQFSKAAKRDESEDHDDSTYFAMFSQSEQLTLGLLMNRKMGECEDVFKDCELQANRHAASLALRFSAEQAPYMHIDKIRNTNRRGFTYKLRQENEVERIPDRA